MRFLKNRFFALLLFLFVMAALPLSVVRCDRGAPSAAARDSADSAEINMTWIAVIKLV